jgi:hypothetical protein
MRHQTSFNDFLKGKKKKQQLLKFFLSTDHDISPRISLPFFFGGAFCTTATPRLPLASPAAL